jgi:hypothetical protein
LSEPGYRTLRFEELMSGSKAAGQMAKGWQNNNHFFAVAAQLIP